MTPEDGWFTFVVLGRAAPQGSKDAHVGKNGKPYLVEASKRVHPWRKQIMKAAKGPDGRPLATFTGPVEIDIEFEFRRAKSNTDEYPTVQTIGDGDKLTRAVWDALTQAKVIEDDAYCVRWSGSKHYAEEDRAYISVRQARPVSMRPIGPAIIDEIQRTLENPPPTMPRSIVDFAQQIGVTLDPWQKLVIHEQTRSKPLCCNPVDHKSCKLFGEDTMCPCPVHCSRRD